MGTRFWRSHWVQLSYSAPQTDLGCISSIGMTCLVDKFPHIGWQIAGERQGVAGNGMDETESRGMESLALETQGLDNRP